jgi:hypothetical protein
MQDEIYKAMSDGWAVSDELNSLFRDKVQPQLGALLGQSPSAGEVARIVQIQSELADELFRLSDVLRRAGHSLKADD